MKKILIALLASTGLMSLPSQAHGGWGAALVGGAVLGSVITANSYYRPAYYSPYAYGGYGPYYQPVYLPPQPILIQQPPIIVTQTTQNIRPIAYYCPSANAYYRELLGAEASELLAA